MRGVRAGGVRHWAGRCRILVALVALALSAGAQTLQERIDACAAAGGGRVTVAAGDWKTGPLHLRSNVELHLEAGARLVFSGNPDDYRPLVRSSFAGIECMALSPLIYARGCTNVAVTGKGVIAPEMETWRVWFDRNTPEMFAAMGKLYEWGESDEPVENRRVADLPGARFRPCGIEFERCRNVRLEDFKVRESPLWTIHLRLCEQVTVRGLDLEARGHNNDGIDVDACRQVRIRDCTFFQGDDGIVIKSGRDRDGRRVGVPCEDVEIRNCTMRGGFTLLAVGSEVSGGVRDIRMYDCRATGPMSTLVKVKTSDRKGAFVENITVSNLTAGILSGPVVQLATDVDYQWRKYPARERVCTRIEKLVVEDVACDRADVVYDLAGDARLPVRGVALRNIRVGEVQRGEGTVANVEAFAQTGIVTRRSREYAEGIAELAAALAVPVLPPAERFATWTALYNRLFDLDAAADEAWLELATRADFDGRRRELRERMVARLGGFPERTPLKPRVTGRVRRQGYSVEKILFESRPGAYVTGNLYLPESAAFRPPYPAAIELCGHTRLGKNHPDYQRVAVLLAKNGVAVMVVDPLGQGERRQSAAEDADSDAPVRNHLRMGVNAMLLGHGFAAFELWDAMRALDYLDTRSDLRHDGYGALGNSGGGTQSVMLSAVDDRVKATATSCFLSNLREQTLWRLLPDCEQLIFGQLADGFGHAAYPLLGGNPVLMLARRDDVIPYSGTRATARLLQAVGRKIGRPTWYQLTDQPGPHGYTERNLRSTADFLVRQLRGEAAVFDESEFGRERQDFGPTEEAALVTDSGSVQTLAGFKSVYAYLQEELELAESRRRPMTGAGRARMVRAAADIDESRLGRRTVISESSLRDGTRIFRTCCETADGYRMPVVELVPPGAERWQPLVLAVDGPRTNVAALIQANRQRAIVIPDLCACGEIGGARHHYFNPRDDEETAKMLYLMGSSLVGRRTGEIIALGKAAQRRWGRNPTVVTTGTFAIAAAHAMAAEPGLFTDFDFMEPPPSWAQAVREGECSDYASSVHGALRSYDWLDLVQ